MPRRREPDNQPPRQLNATEIANAIARLQRRIIELEEFKPQAVQQRGGPEVTALRASIEQTLSDIFGHGSTDYKRYSRAAHFDGGPISLNSSWISARGGGGGTDLRFRSYYEEDRVRAIALLQQAISSLEERAEFFSDDKEPRRNLQIDNENVFIVHGHHGEAREAIARFIEKIGLKPIILHERPNKGRTLIAKFSEESSGVGFAVVIMTPDDLGGTSQSDLKPRARQNVIFEMGFLIGALGLERVAAIIADGVERPSDFEGVVYIPYDGDWKTQLAKELQAAGIAVDWNKIMRG